MKGTHALLRDASWTVGYAAVFYALFQTAQVFWYLPAGLRFTALLLSPYRRWPWLIGVEVPMMLAMYPRFAAEHGIAYAMLVFASNPALAASGPWLLRQRTWSLRPASLASMAWLLGAMAVAAIGATIGNLDFPFNEEGRYSTLSLLLQLTLGDFIGMAALAPLLLMAMRDRPDGPTLQRWRIDVPLALLPVLLLYAALVLTSGEPDMFFFAALLCLLPGIYFAARSGWRGVALTLLAASLAIALSGVLVGNPSLTVEAQGFIAVAGSANLLLGAAHDALQRSQTTLSERNVSLVAANERRERLAAELRDAARRNLDLSEQMRRWITSELHDEIGQNLAALQTRVRLLERKSGMQDSEIASDMRKTLDRMRHTVSGLMASLRPAGLDDFGLTHALRQGAVRELVEASGVAFDLVIDDDDEHLDCLGNDLQTALYRVVQEAATNTVRHAQATRFLVHLRMRTQTRNGHVLLAITDDGVGFDPARHTRGIGVQGIRDRVIALGGRLRLRSGESGTTLVTRIPLAMLALDQSDYRSAPIKPVDRSPGD